MALHVYRYKWVGLNLELLNLLIDPNLPASIVQTGTQPLIDVQADDSTKLDLDLAMGNQGWSFVATDPTTPATGFVIRQEVTTRLLVDASTSSNAFVDLLSVTMTTEGGWLSVVSQITSECVGDLGYARIVLNGAPLLSSVHPIGEANTSLVGRVQVPAGTYTAKLQWRVDGSGTQHARPVTMPDAEFASLLLRDTST